MTSKYQLAILIVSAPLAVASSAHSATPSFDCAKARTATEIQICQSPRLAELDNVLAPGYAFLKSTRGRAAADQIGIPYWRLITQCDGGQECIGRRQIDEIAALRAAGAPISIPAWADKNGSVAPDPVVKPTVSTDQSSVSAFKALTGVVIRSRCHMNYCGWFRIDQSTLALESVEKSMFEIKLSYWGSDYPDGNYDTVRPRKFTGNATSYVVCSKQRPSIIERDENSGWTQTQLAPGAKDGIFGYSESALAIYWAACHAMNVQDVYSATAVANKMGYPGAVAVDGLTQTNLADPMDGFGVR
jgi:uncharacterized protein